MIAAGKRRERLRPQQAMGIRNRANGSHHARPAYKWSPAASRAIGSATDNCRQSIPRQYRGSPFQLGPGASSLACGFSSWRPDCVAGHVRFELRNVAANYPFERSHKFPEMKPNSGRRDYSCLSCGVAATQLGPSARMSAAFLARALLIRRIAYIARISADPEMIRRRPIEQYHCALCAGLVPPRERVWWSRPASLTACSSPPPAPYGPRGV
jgi:hypothetical protein